MGEEEEGKEEEERKRKEKEKEEREREEKEKEEKEKEKEKEKEEKEKEKGEELRARRSKRHSSPKKPRIPRLPPPSPPPSPPPPPSLDLEELHVNIITKLVNDERPSSEQELIVGENVALFPRFVVGGGGRRGRRKGEGGVKGKEKNERVILNYSHKSLFVIHNNNKINNNSNTKIHSVPLPTRMSIYDLPVTKISWPEVFRLFVLNRHSWMCE